MAAVAGNGIRSSDQFMGRSAKPIANAASAAASSESESQYQLRELVVDLLSKLNPSAKEFFPSSSSSSLNSSPPQQTAVAVKTDGRLSADAPVFVASTDFYNNVYSSNDGSAKNQLNFKRRNGVNQGRRRMNERVRRAERDESVRRTVYVSDIDLNVTEEHLAELFATCGQVIDCRVCGDPHSHLRFAFVEFADMDGARSALSLNGTMLGYYPVKVLPSKTAILPVNPTFLPRSNDEREMVMRTVYCTNIDKKVTQSDVKNFFERACGQVSRLRLLGDNVHSTRIAFVEFAVADSAIMALNCSGVLLGALPIRVSPSKTPVRPRVPRANNNILT